MLVIAFTTKGLNQWRNIMPSRPCTLWGAVYRGDKWLERVELGHRMFKVKFDG